MNYIIVGLGNPGQEYENTRHNTGRIVVDTFAKKVGVNELNIRENPHSYPRKSVFWKEDKKIKSEIAKIKLGKNTALLIKPNTFMNKSGDVVRTLIKNKKSAETLVIIHDDLDIPFGKIKISFNKSAGGHKGVQSIIKAAKTENFIRIRIGIAPVTKSGKIKKPQGEKAITDLILGKFKLAEQDILRKIIKKAVEGLELIITEGREVAMMKVNSN